MSYSIGDVGAGIGVERRGDMQNLVAGVSAALGDASVKVVFGRPTTVMTTTTEYVQCLCILRVRLGHLHGLRVGNSRRTDGDHFGIGAAFDLGGGAAIKGGFADGDSMAGASFDLGLTMGF